MAAKNTDRVTSEWDSVANRDLRVVSVILVPQTPMPLSQHVGSGGGGQQGRRRLALSSRSSKLPSLKIQSLTLVVWLSFLCTSTMAKRITLELRPVETMHAQDWWQRRQRQHQRRQLKNAWWRGNHTNFWKIRNVSRPLRPQHHQSQEEEPLGLRHAIYASIPDPQDPQYRNDRHLQEFHSRRHLSRYEQMFRLQNNIDLELETWDGMYDDVDDDEGLTATDNDNKNTDSSENFPNVGYFKEERLINSEFNHSELPRPPMRHRALAPILPVQPPAPTIMATNIGNTATPNRGGQLNHYQAVPLAQGYGTHFVSVWVGSPTPQRKTVIVDTGSHYTAFPCQGCQDCGSVHHTDPYFDPEKSKTFHQLQCNECRDGVICETYGSCQFRQSYTEGSSWEAVQVTDRFYCSGSDVMDSVKEEDVKYSIDFMFGCQTSMKGLFKTQLADGIMGMSAHAATLPKQLFDHKLLEHNMFAMCYRRELATSRRGVLAGSMDLGGVSTALDSSPIVWAKNMAKLGWYTVYVKNIYIRQGGGQSAKSIDDEHTTIKVKMDPSVLNSGKGVIVDSGTTDTYLNKEVAPEFNRAWKMATGQNYSHLPMRLTKEQILRLPTVLVQCHAFQQRGADPSVESYEKIPGYAGRLDPTAPNDLLIAIPATSYMDYSPITGMYTSRIYFSESSGGVLGSNAMQGHNVVFDWEHGRVGFAESACTYDKKDVPEAGQDSAYERDCKVRQAVLTTPCVDTVDKAPCKTNPTNIAVLGTETWTGIVESAGTADGVLCSEVAKESTNAADQAGGSLVAPTTTCSGEGFCEEERPCQLSCSQVTEAQKVKPDFGPKSKKLDCGDSLWSTCDHACIQTRIISRAHTDGNCHEFSREHRPCHIEACARKDPCIVPFLIHVTIGLEGVSWREWTGVDEILFVSALAKAAVILGKDVSFGPGDANVLLAIPWYIQDDDPDNIGRIDDTIGTKVVLEISVFNPDAISRLPVPANSSSPTTGQSLEFLQNLTEKLTGSPPRAICDPDQLFALAKTSLLMKKTIFESPILLPTTIKAMEILAKADKKKHIFGPLLGKNGKSGSKVLASWTIQTAVDKTVNLSGPPRPIWHKLLSLVHVGLLVLIFSLMVSSFWSLATSAYEFIVGKSMALGLRYGRHRYSSVELSDDTEERVMGMQVEMTRQDSISSANLQTRRGTTATKRKPSAV